MTDLTKKYQEIIKDLTNKIKDPNELAYVKEKLSELLLTFTESTISFSEITKNQSNLEKKVRNLSRDVKHIKEDIYVRDDDECDCEDDCDCGDDCNCGHHSNCGCGCDNEDYEFEIICPYCDFEFVVGKDTKNKKEIKCPKCSEVIELDWDEDEIENSVAEDDADYKTKKDDEDDM